MAKKNGAATDPVLAEMQSIKRLLVFGLLRSGASQGEIAMALGVNQSNVSRMFQNALGDVKARAGKPKTRNRG